MGNKILKNILTKISPTVAASATLSFMYAVTFPKAEAASFTPPLIREDLFFGRDIPGGGEVSNADFQGFINNVITPRFPDGLTVYDTAGQYLDSTGTIIKEKSKDVALFIEDTPQNQANINDIVGTYLQQFNQESVLQVVDKNVDVSFISSAQLTSVTEPDYTLGVLALGIFGAGSALKKKLVSR